MNVIEIDNLTKVYPDGTRANDGISINVKRNEIVGLIGPNGAGKDNTNTSAVGAFETHQRFHSGHGRRHS